MNAVQVRLVSGDAAWLQERAGQLTPVDDIVIAARHQLADLTEPDAVPAPAVLVVDAGTSPTETIAALSPLTSAGRPACAIVLLLRPGDEPAQLYPHAALHGVRVVLPASCALPDLAEAIYSASAYIPSPRASEARYGADAARLLVVFGTKGGSGRTTLAVNLGVHFAARGLRSALIDLHLDWGNVGAHTRVNAPRSFSDLIAESGRLDPDLLLSFMGQHASGLRVLPAPPKPEMAEFVTPAHVETMLRVARQSFDAVVVDTPAGFPETLQPALEAGDHILVLTQPEVPALRNTRAALRILEMLQVPRTKLHLVLAQAGRGKSIRQADVEATLGMPVWATLPADEAPATRAAAEGIPVVTLAPASRLSRAIDGIGRLLVPAAQISGARNRQAATRIAQVRG